MTETMEELEVIPATKSPHGFLVSPLTDNIHMTDEGYLVVVGCPIARTGWQAYRVKDLPQERAKELGVDVSNPEASIDLYRPEREVFHPEFLASLNGKPIVDGHPPNGEFVDPKNFKKFACGHVQNPRKGPEPLEDGEWPIIADLVISDHQLIEKVKSKAARDNSLGYDFSIDRDGDKICQTHMSANHDAVVPDGRAGDFVSIADAADADAGVTQHKVASEQSSPINPAPAEVIEAPAYKPIVLNFHKEKRPVAEKKQQNWLRSLMGKHLIEKARATDADPDTIMDEAESMLNDDAEPPKNTGANEFKSEDKKRGKDGELPEALKEHQFKPKGEDRRSRDEEEEEMADARKKAHDALDRALDARVGDSRRAKDADIEELKDLLDEYLDEEEREPEHADDKKRAKDRKSKDDEEDEDCMDTEELEKTLKGEDAEPCPDCGEVHDSEECPGEEEVESGEEVLDEEGESPDPDSDDDEEDVEPAGDKRRAKDRARAADAAAGASAVLKALRPIVARSSDKAVRTAFNRALDSVKKSSRASTGGYGAFASSARARDKAPRNPNPDRARAADGSDPLNKLQAAYDSALKGGK